MTLGVLLGGDTRNLVFKKEDILDLLSQIKAVAYELDLQVLLTTSRRTHPDIAAIVKKELGDYAPCKLSLIANEKNIPAAVEGILGLSDIVLVSPESISMISEAANSEKLVLVFDLPGIDPKHRDFLRYFAGRRYIYLTPIADLKKNILKLLEEKPEVLPLQDNLAVRQAIERIL